MRTVKEYKIEMTESGRFVIMQADAYGIFWIVEYGISYASREEAQKAIEELKS